MKKKAPTRKRSHEHLSLLSLIGSQSLGCICFCNRSLNILEDQPFKMSDSEQSTSSANAPRSTSNFILNELSKIKSSSKRILSGDARVTSNNKVKSCDCRDHSILETAGYWTECERLHFTSPIPYQPVMMLHNVSNPDNALITPVSYLLDGDSTSDYYSYRSEISLESSPDTEYTLQQSQLPLAVSGEEIYKYFFHGHQQVSSSTTDESIGSVIVTFIRDTYNSQDVIRLICRTVCEMSYLVLPISFFGDRVRDDQIVSRLSKYMNITPSLRIASLPEFPDELLKIDTPFIKQHVKIGVIWVKENQTTLDDIFNNENNSPLFDQFLDLLGDRVRLSEFKGYDGGLPQNSNLQAVVTVWRNIEFMFHVSTFLPFVEDERLLERKRHIYNDIVCFVFLEAKHTKFSPSVMTSKVLHSFIVVQIDPDASLNDSTPYRVGVVARNTVPLFDCRVPPNREFPRNSAFREWLLTKAVNGERASYSSKDFCAIHRRTRRQLLDKLLDQIEAYDSEKKNRMKIRTSIKQLLMGATAGSGTTAIRQSKTDQLQKPDP